MSPELPSALLREGLLLLVTVGAPLFAVALGVGLGRRLVLGELHTRRRGDDRVAAQRNVGLGGGDAEPEGDREQQPSAQEHQGTDATPAHPTAPM